MKSKKWPCVTLIGMPGAGKTTIGSKLAKELNWAFMDTDNVIEALYAARLQDITDALGKDAFLDVENEVIRQISAGRCVISTGGSVIYRAKAMERLKRLGPVVFISLSLAQIEERIARNPERGIAIAPGQSIKDLYEERRELYDFYADIICDINGKNPEECVLWIYENLKKSGIIKNRSGKHNKL